VIRHFGDLPASFTGCDRSPAPIKWCRHALPFGTYAISGDAPPLPFDDHSFDLAYATSVFTHIPAELQSAWLNELRRVVQPGGLLLFTTHGKDIRSRLNEGERARFERGELVVQGSHYGFSNHFAAYHPEPFISGPFTSGLARLGLVDGHRRSGKLDQDLHPFAVPDR
jgi:ubiquinone/menaquinone biosynthesis C-methylase UbiE